MIQQTKASATLACPALLMAISVGGASAGGNNAGGWSYRTETDLTKSTVYVAEFTNLTSSLALRCGGPRGDYLAVNVGFVSQQLTTLAGNRRVTVDLDFRKTKGTTPQGDRAFSTTDETAEAIGSIEMHRADILVADALVLFDEVDVTIHDPRSAVFDMHAAIPLSGAVGPVRAVFANCPELKGLPVPGTKPAWHAFDKVFEEMEKIR